MNQLRLCGVSFVIVVFVLISSVPPASAWGEDGHRFINRVAAEKLPEDMPSFFRNAGVRLSFLGPEPDRWRDNRELFKALTEVNGPDHFIDIDKAENFDALPNDRYEYADWLRTNGKTPRISGSCLIQSSRGIKRFKYCSGCGAIAITKRSATRSSRTSSTTRALLGILLRMARSRFTRRFTSTAGAQARTLKCILASRCTGGLRASM